MTRHLVRASMAIDGSPLLAWLVIAAMCVLAQGCSQKSEPGQTFVVESSGIPTVVVTNSVVEDFVNTLCEDRVLVVKISIVSNSTGWRPASDQLGQLQKADLILLSGANYEPWAAQLSLPRSRLVDTSAAYSKQLISVEDSVGHQHGPNGEGTGKQLAWATWLDPEQAIQQIRAVEDAVCKLEPESAQMFVERSNAMSAELEELDQRIQTLAAKSEGLTVQGVPLQHSYLTRRLGWKLIAAKQAASSEIDLVLATEQNTVSRAGVPTVKIQVCDRLSDIERPLECMAKNLDRLEAAVQVSLDQPDSGSTAE